MLGPVEVRSRGEPLRIGTPRARAVLAILLIHSGQLVSVDQLVDELWPTDPPRHARTIVHGLVSRLRRMLRDSPDGEAAAARLTTRKPGYLLHVEDDELDLRRFERLIRDGRAAREQGALDRCLDLFGQAQQQWRGLPFADVPTTPVIGTETARLIDLRLCALEEQFDANLAAGHAAGIVAELTKLVAEHPLRERLTGQLMLALYHSGRAADALDAYRQVKQRLAEDLGLDPGPDLARLELAILRNDPALASPTVDESPATSPRPAQLPADLPTFTGRGAELEALLAAGDPDVPAVVISAIDGMAGVGKTSLAVHAAHRLAPRYPDGQLFIDLHGFTQNIDPVQPADALDRLLRALGVPGEQIPQGLEDRAALYRSQLAERRMIILLDNAVTETQVDPLLPGAPGCLVLVTSRRHLTGLSLARPLCLDVLPTDEAAALFAQVAGGQRPTDPALIDHVVQLCDRLPLAIQIAGARLRARPNWTLAHLLDRLRDEQHRLSELEAGHRSVASAFGISYQQLTTEQQRMFRLLGLHPGPDIDAEAAAALADTTAQHAGRLLEDLVDAHLLGQHAPGRYRFHDLIRRHAADTAAREEPAADRHAALTRLLDHYLRRAADAAGQLGRPPGSAPGLVWLDAERVNLVAAASHAAQHGWPEHACQLSETLQRYLDIHALFSDALTLHDQALRAARGNADTRAEGRILNHLGVAHQRLGHNAVAVEYLQQAHTASEAADDLVGQARSLSSLGVVYYMIGQFTEAVDCLQRASTLFREIGDQAGEIRSIGNLGLIYMRQRRYADSLHNHRQCLRLCRATGDRSGESQVHYSLGVVNRLMGRPAEAIDHLQQAARLVRQLGDRAGESYALADLGAAYGLVGRTAEAIDCHRQALALSRQTGERNAEIEALLLFGDTLRLIGQPEHAMSHHQAALALASELDQRHDRARAHDAIAHIHHGLGEHDLAYHHWERALALYDELGVPEADQIRAQLQADIVEHSS